MEIVIASIAGVIIGGVVVFIIRRLQDNASKKSARVEAEKILQRAKSESHKIKKDSETKAKDFETRARKNAEQEIQKQKSQLKNKESQFDRRIKELDEQAKSLQENHDRNLQEIADRQNKIKASEERLQNLEKSSLDNIDLLKRKLESVAQMSTEQARQQLFETLEKQVQKEAHVRLSKIEAEAEKEADGRARRILSQAVARFASEYTSERTVTVLALTSDEMKGKIIGREGRNIRTLEAMCGVDLIVDDTPEAVVISGFDPVRRELARRTIVKLMEDGRVHPARIEEVAEKQRVELMKSLKEEGEKTVLDLGLAQVHPEIMKVLGSLKYRQTHSQNALFHCIEVATLAGLLAAEIGVNPKTARRAGLLSGIGLGVDHTAEGSYSIAGAEFAKKYNETDEVVQAIRSHQEEEKPNSSLAWIVFAANALSASRPGARRPHMDGFINRLIELESIGNSFEGVLKTYALQAGKEVRVLIESSRVTDDQASMLSRDIVRKIEREMPQLNQVRVTVVRQTRAVEFAR